MAGAAHTDGKAAGATEDDEVSVVDTRAAPGDPPRLESVHNDPEAGKTEGVGSAEDGEARGAEGVGAADDEAGGTKGVDDCISALDTVSLLALVGSSDSLSSVSRTSALHFFCFFFRISFVSVSLDGLVLGRFLP